MTTQTNKTQTEEYKMIRRKDILIRRVIKSLSKEQIEYILKGYLDDETIEELQDRIK
jgi:hypothetical protein